MGWRDTIKTESQSQGGTPAGKSWRDSIKTDAPQEESFATRATRQVLDTVLPVGAAIAAGAVATPESLGLATIPAGAAGYAAGKQASRILKHHILGDELEAKDAGDVVKQTASDLGEGAIAEMGGQVIGKGVEAAAPFVKPIFNKAGEIIGYFSEKLSAAAEKAAAKSVGATAKDMENVAATRKLGRNALDNKISGPYTSAEKSLEKAQGLKDKAAEKMNQVFDKIDETGARNFSPLDTATKVEGELAPSYRTKINKSEVTQLENTLDSILERGDKPISLSEAQALKKEIDSVGYPKGKKPIDPTPKQQMAQDAARIIRDHIDEAAQAGANEIKSPELIKQLSEARAEYGANKETVRLLKKQVGKEGMETGRKINWTLDPVAFGSSVARKFGPKYNATKAIALDTASGAAKTIPEAVVNAAAVAEKAAPRAATAQAIKSGQSLGELSPKAADNEEPTKGPDKWANDGFKKLMDHVENPQDKKILEGTKGSMLQNPKAKKLLIAASDLKPGSMALDKIIEELNTLSGEKQ